MTDFLLRGGVFYRRALCSWISASIAFWLALFLYVGTATAQAQHYSSMGLSGLIHMPDARMTEDGTLGVGYSHAKPYSSVYVTAQMLPFLQASARYTNIHGLDLSDRPGWEGYGDYKDKRSEEHTSELQSRGHLVCRLLLEKKKISSDCESKDDMQ